MRYHRSISMYWVQASWHDGDTRNMTVTEVYMQRHKHKTAAIIQARNRSTMKVPFR
jgi:hypothetical protein